MKKKESKRLHRISQIRQWVQNATIALYILPVFCLWFVERMLCLHRIRTALLLMAAVVALAVLAVLVLVWLPGHS